MLSEMSEANHPMNTKLAVVGGAEPAASPSHSAESLAARVQRLQAEARVFAREHITALEAALEQVTRLSAEVAEGGEAYPVGVRELAERLAQECESQRQTIEAILARGRLPR